MGARADGTTKPRLLLVGAGATEIGHMPRSGAREPNLRGAVLPYLLDNLVGPPPGFLFVNAVRAYEVALVIRFDKLPVIPPPRRRSALRSVDADKVRRALFIAEQAGLDGVIVLIDRESKRSPDRAQRLRQGRQGYRRNAPDSRVACAVGAACRSVETWLLADSQGRHEVFGDAAANPFTRDPEDRPPPRILKEHIRSEADRVGLSRSDAYERLAQAARPDELRQRCQTSYPPFADDVRGEIIPLLPPK